MMLSDYTETLEKKRKEISDWMKAKRSEVPIPIYGSVDVRDSGWKVAVVDANHFPAGFNNVSEENIAELSTLFKDHIQRSHPGCQWVHIYPESHTRNQAYVENISAIKGIVEAAGFACTVGSPSLNGLKALHGISGPLMLAGTALNDDEELTVNGKVPDLILLNNDLTDGSIPGVTSTNVTPPPHMGWHRRRKSQHYDALKPYIFKKWLRFWKSILGTLFRTGLFRRTSAFQRKPAGQNWPLKLMTSWTNFERNIPVWASTENRQWS